MDQLFATDNALDIPMLDARWQPTGLEPPLKAWGTARRGKPMSGTWHFYVDDYRFERVWERPDLLLETGAIAAVEPNFSVFDMTPAAVAINQTYRKRWLGRYWQDNGVRVWVDLNVSVEHRELNMLGVPLTWRAFATRGYESHPGSVLDEFLTVAERAPVFLVYGGGPKVRALADSIGAIHVPDEQSTTRDRLRRVIAGHWRGSE